MSDINYDNYLQQLKSMEKNEVIAVSISDLINSLSLIERQTGLLEALLELDKLDREKLENIILRLKDGSSDLRTMLSALRQYNRET